MLTEWNFQLVKTEESPSSGFMKKLVVDCVRENRSPKENDQMK